MLILEGHRGIVRILAFSPDGTRLVSLGGKDRLIWLWDLTEGKCLQQAQSQYSIQSVAFNPTDNSVIVCCDSMGSVLCYHWESQQWSTYAQLTPSTQSRIELAFSPDGKYLVATAPLANQFSAYAVTLWEWPTQTTRRFSHYNAGSITFAPQGDWFATGGRNRHVRIWSPQRKAPVHEFDHAKKVHFVRWSPDNRSLASATLNGFVRIWDLEHGRKKQLLSSKSKVMQGIAWSHDGSTLTTADIDGVVRFWDAERGTLEKVFHWEIGEIHCVAFDNEGMRAAAGGQGRIMIWDMDSD